MRELAKVRKVSGVLDIPSATSICQYVVDGWKVVDTIGKYSVGDLVIMCEIDSWIPTSVAPFLTKPGKFPKEYLGVQGERLKTIRLRGALSQGLLLQNNGPYEEGEDVTEFLGITKWESAEDAGTVRNAKGSFPVFLQKTDQSRVQNLTREIAERAGESFEVTVKIDGCFGYRTRVKTFNGETVCIGDIVSKGLDPMLIGIDGQGNCVPTKITKRFNNGTKTNWVDLVFAAPQKSMCVGKSGKLRVTANHKIFKEDFTEISANELKSGDRILFNIDTPSKSVMHFIKSSLLGDGTVCGKHGKNNRFCESHLTSVDYAKYVERALGDCFVSHRVITSGFGSQITQTLSKHFLALDSLRSEWYKAPGKTNLPEDISWIDDFTVAKWYLDDGSLSHSDLQNDRACFSTNGFSKEEVERLAAKLSELYGVSVSVYESRGWNIRVNYNNGTINNMWEKITPHIPQCFRYKVPEIFRSMRYIEYPVGKVEQSFVSVDLVDVQVVPFNKQNFPSGSVGFDIETETHNYFCGGILVHNSSLTAYHYNGEVGVCSRNIELKEDEGNAFWSIVRKERLLEKLTAFGGNLAIQGELIAPNIQSNHENVTKPEFHCFSIFDIDKQEYLCPTFRRAVCDRLGIPHVKVVDENFILYHNVDQLLEMAEGEGMNPNVKREGIVFKSNTSQFSFKAISNKFLLKGGD